MFNCSNNSTPAVTGSTIYQTASGQGIKRARDDSDVNTIQRESGEIKCRRISTTEGAEEEGPFIKLPQELLISIIQKNALFGLRGLFLSCKMFSSLIFKNIRTIVLENKKELPHLPTILEKAVSQSNQSLVNLAIWTSCSQPGLVNDETFNSIRHFPNITKLILGRTQDLCKVSSEGFVHLTALKSLELLEINYLEIDASSVNEVMKSLSNLKSLRLRGVNVESSHELISSLATTSLQTLGLWTAGFPRIPDSEFTSLRRQTQLKELILSSCQLNRPDSFKDVAQLVHLQHLGLFCVGNLISSEKIATLDTLTNLRALNLGGCHVLGPYFAASLLKLKTVTELSISRPSGIYVTFVSSIQQMNLKILRFSSTAHIPDQNFADLCSIPTLEKLDLDNIQTLAPMRINIALQYIPKHPNLSELRLLNLPNIDDEKGIKHLKDMPKLKALTIMKCSNVTNVALQYISKHPNLIELRLESLPKIDDEGIKHFENTPTLTTLNVMSCPKVTQKAIANFYASRPKPS